MIFKMIKGSSQRTKIHIGNEFHSKKSKLAATTRFVGQNCQTKTIEQKFGRMFRR